MKDDIRQGGSGRVGPARTAAPWAGSLALHALLLGAVGLALARHGAPPPAPSVSISFGERAAAPAARPAAPATPEPAHETEVVAPTARLTAPELNAETLALPSADVALVAPEWEAPLDAGAPAPVAAEAPAPELFGARGERTATRVVYVIDASGSMVAALQTVVRELERSTERLGPESWVQALVFQNGGFSTAPGMDRDSLVKATDANKRGLIRWLGSVRAGGRGDAIPALERAITYRPDVIFLVSKGLGEAALGSSAAVARADDVLARLEALNPASGTGARRPVSIKVIQFFDQDAGGLMSRIGRAHGGEDGYTFISRKDLGLE